MKIRFVSAHAVGDPSNGASLSIRDIFEILVDAGAEVRTVTGPWSDLGGLSLLRREDVLGFAPDATFERFRAKNGFEGQLASFRMGRVPMQVLTTNDDGPRQVPRDTGPEAGATIEAIVRDIDQDRPDLVVSYGGGPVGRALRAEFDRRKLPVVYRVVNHGYANADFFRGVAGILTCSRYLAHFYEAKFGIPFTAIHPPIDRARIRASNRTAPKYLTFVSPMIAKGVVLAAAVFAELAKSRPDIPPLVVLGRGQMGTFRASRVDLTPIDHLHVMETTPDPRQFLAETKVLLMPSLDEPAGRVAAEAMLNGIPVLAARAAGLVEVVGGAGVSLDLPDTVAFGEKRAPTSKEIEPWVRAIVRLWDDAAHYEERSATASLRGELFTQETLGPAYVKFFEGVVGRPFVPRKETEPRSAVAPETKGTIKAFRF